MTEASIVVPIINEKKYILATVNNINIAFGEKNISYEIIFVDDNSTDGSVELIKKLSHQDSRIKLINHDKNEGLGSASIAGYKKAVGEIIMQIDGDFAQDVRDLILMREELRTKNIDMVIGSRYMPGGSQVGKSLIRDWGSRSMNFIASFLLSIPFKDFTHTFRIFKRTLFLGLHLNLKEKGHPGFFIELTFWAIKKNYKISEFPSSYKEREDGSAVSKIRISREIPRFLKIVFLLFFNNLKSQNK